jgi:hypothetical protein
MPWTVDDVDRFKSGLNAAQKRQWVEVANSALASCLADGKEQSECEASAIRQANGVINDNIQTYSFTANNYEIRRETHNGREHIVVPVIMLKDGVHNGSRGPLLHLVEEYGRCPQAWNGIPVTLSHPKDNKGNLIPANSPEVIDLTSTGRIYNTHVNGMLKAEVWIDELKCQELSPETLEAIKNHHPLNVSVGVFSDEDESPGQWNGEDYTAIARNHRPDHLALLLSETGACSWDDGCGIRANSKGGDELKKGKEDIADNKSAEELNANARGFKGICSGIQAKLDAMDNNVSTYYLEEAFDDNTFIYKVRGGDAPGLYKRGYQVAIDGTISFTGEPQEVTVEKTYTPVQGNFKTEGGMETMADKKKGCCPEKVNLIIQSEHTRFEETDREYLEGLEEGTLVKLLPIEPETPEAPQVNKDQIAEVVKDQFKTTEQFLSLAPAEVREQMEHGMALYQAEREKLTSQIVDNSGEGGFTAEELKDKPVGELKKLASLIQKPADYSGNGAGSTHQANTEDVPVLVPLGVSSDKE